MARVSGLTVSGLDRATGRPLEAFLRPRLFEPLGMVDTALTADVAIEP